MLYGSGFMVWGLGLMVQGLGFRLYALGLGGRVCSGLSRRLDSFKAGGAWGLQGSWGIPQYNYMSRSSGHRLTNSFLCRPLYLLGLRPHLMENHSSQPQTSTLNPEP